MVIDINFLVKIFSIKYNEKSLRDYFVNSFKFIAKFTFFTTGNRLDGTCEGFCEGASDGRCYCDNACHHWGDCCQDKVNFCGEEDISEDSMMSTTYMPPGDDMMSSTYMTLGDNMMSSSYMPPG